MTIERNFDVPLIASLAFKEKQIQQNYRPIIAVHKWFARRPGALFRGLVLAEFSEEPLAVAYFRPNDFPDLKVADPFMGGGTPLIEANRMGCDVQGFDINPMSAWIVREEIEHIDLEAYSRAAEGLMAALQAEIGDLYRTSCPIYGDFNVPVKYFLWVKVLDCENCGEQFDLFPGYLLAEDRRHPKNVLVCSACGDLNEVDDRKDPGDCKSCRAALDLAGPARRNRCACAKCGHINTYPRAETGAPKHRMFAIEYFNPNRKDIHKGRFFKKPDADDLDRADVATEKWRRLDSVYVPTQEILPGDETNRLHRWGYNFYSDMFNPRQLLGLERSCRHIAKVKDERIRHALATNLSDLLRYQNMLCRYDTMALKSLDIFSVHGFPVGLVQCESNLFGITAGNGTSVGSGGWSNIINKYSRAKRYCSAPFEVRRSGSRNVRVPIHGEWIGEYLNEKRPRKVSIRCASSTSIELPKHSLDAVFTDPPYFGNVQYGELMDFCYVWLRRLVGKEPEGFELESARSPDELTGNITQNRGLENFTEGLSAVYSRMTRALKPGAPFVFTFHHNKLDAYYSVGVAILDAGLVCSVAIPCPAEMGGSIHIHGSGSSIVDTVFVCRTTGSTKRRSLFETAEELKSIVVEDLDQLKEAGMTPTTGDTRCIINGHVTRMAVWNLRQKWLPDKPIQYKLNLFASAISRFGDIDHITGLVATATLREIPLGPLFVAEALDQEVHDAISF